MAAAIINPIQNINGPTGQRYSQSQFLTDVRSAVQNSTFTNTPWTAYRKGICLSLLIDILIAVSGNDLIPLTNDIVLSQHNNQPLLNQLPATDEHRNVLHELAEYSRDVKHYDKWKALQFVESDFKEKRVQISTTLLRTLGYGLSKVS